MIRLALTPSSCPASAMARCRPSITVANAMPRDGVALRIEEHLDVADIVRVRALEIGPGEVVEILLGDQHRHALIIDVEKVLQVAETDRPAAALRPTR